MSLFSEFDLFRRSVHQLFSEFERDFLNDRYLLDTHFADYPSMQQAMIGAGAMDVDENQNNQTINNNNATPSKPDTTPNTNNNNNKNQTPNTTNATGTTATNNAARNNQLQSTRGTGGGAVMNRYPSLFSSSLAPWYNQSLSLRSFPASCKMDVIEKSDRYEVHAELAGIPKENIKIEINDGLLTLSGEHRIQKEEKSLNDNNNDNNNENKDNTNTNNNNNNSQQPQYHYRERSYSSVKRSLRLPENIDQEKIGAKFDNGLLEIYLPKKEKITPKTLNVQIA